jgi:hypothetical protein
MAVNSVLTVLGPNSPIELLYVAHPQRDDDEVPVPPPGYWYPRWDDDEYGFVLVPRACVSTKS